MFHFPKGLTRHSLNVLACIALVSVFTKLSAMGFPHFQGTNPPRVKAARPSSQYGPKAKSQPGKLPQNVLVLRVQFTDVQFRTTAAYPDSLVHDIVYFQRWMQHLRDFYDDASHGAYQLQYSMPETVYTLPNTMAYYGADTSTESDARVEQMLAELIQLSDPDLDYTVFDAIIVFHAGAGQETDVGLPSNNFEPLRPQTIWSTFLSRDDFQAAFDPENDAYPGIQTQDGNFVTEIVLMPEHEFHDYYPLPPDQNSAAYYFSLYGVLCHQFGHQLGLPTLFDNVSSNGASQGIGNWGLMGTGVWNANGFVPAQLDAWCRYYLGWETAQTIQYDAVGQQVDYFLNRNATAPRLYKIPISQKEYFLIENRQQNPDNSIDPYDGSPSYTFTLQDTLIQDYYPDYPQRPFFNFMENRYKNCEWDFFLPGLGGPLQPGEILPTDGSGMLIWHIDENIIAENFTADFEYNHVNGDALHKGVDLEEADGIQQLDTADFDYYKYGGPFDSFRLDENNSEASNPYFGNETYQNFLHLPTAASYYGGIPVEIYDISTSGKVMTFSVRFGWKLDTGYSGINTLDACSIDYDLDGENEIFYPMPNGELYAWKDELMLNGLPALPGNLNQSYTWDGTSLYFPIDVTTGTDHLRITKLTDGVLTSMLWMGNKAAAPMISIADQLLLATHTMVDNHFTSSELRILSSADLQGMAVYPLPDSLCTNLVYYQDKAYMLTKGDTGYKLSKLSPEVADLVETVALALPADSLVVSMLAGKLLPGSDGNIVIQTPFSAYMFDLNGVLCAGYPVLLPFACTAQAQITDVDKNGNLDLVLGGENTLAVLDYTGANILTNFTGLSPIDSLNIVSGALAGDYDGDGKTEFMGAFSRNRLAIWDDNQRFLPGYPVSFAERSLNLPFIHKASDNVTYAWLPANNGKIYRAAIDSTALIGMDENWYCRYANLARTSSWEGDAPPNQYQTDELFVPGEVYVFPNPLKPIYEQKLTFQIMTSRDTQVQVSVYNVRGNQLFEKKVNCSAWLKNREQIDFPVDQISSGVYIAVFKSGNAVKRIKFAVEK